MKKIIYIMGKSSTGKDTIYRELLNILKDKVKPITLFTTRPPRSTEVEGREYHFITKEELNKLSRDNKVIEQRVYNTIYGPWTYATIDNNIDPNVPHIALGTLVSLEKMRNYFGEDNIIPIYLEVDDDIRRERTLLRLCEFGDTSDSDEAIRRWEVDEIDFSKKKIAEARVNIIDNSTDDISVAINKILEYIDF